MTTTLNFFSFLILLHFTPRQNFEFLYENFGLNETLKTHVILAHFGWYFENTGTNFRNTNGEFVEAAHYSLKNHEHDHGYVVKKKQGTPHHLLKALQSLSSFNSMRVGATPPQEFTLRKKKTPSSTPSSTPLSTPSSTPKVKEKNGFSPLLFSQDTHFHK